MHIEENDALRAEDGDQSIAPESSSAAIDSDPTDPTEPSVDRKRNGGRRPKIVPPPPIAASSVAGGVRLTSDDVKALAADIGLNIVIGSDQLEAHTTSIHGALHDYVLWSRGDEVGSPASQVEAWAQSMSRWAEEGIVLFGGNTGEGSPAWGDQTAIRSILSYLPRAWPMQESEDESERNDWKRLETLMRMLAPQAKPANIPNYRLMRDLLVGLLHGLGVLAVLAPRESEPAGPALNWTRALFQLMAGRAGELRPPPARPPAPTPEIDQLLEFGELARWAMKTDALAERIKESSRL
jgi:hypothetical protein